MEPTLIDIQATFMILGKLTCLFIICCGFGIVVYGVIKGLTSFIERMIN